MKYQGTLIAVSDMEKAMSLAQSLVEKKEKAANTIRLNINK